MLTGNTAASYFETPDQSLDDAQLAKSASFAAKLIPIAGQCMCSTLAAAMGRDLGNYLAETAGASVTGNHPFAGAAHRRAQRQARGRARTRDKDRVPAAGLSRHHRTFDRIVSVGMFEHVGVSALS